MDNPLGPLVGAFGRKLLGEPHSQQVYFLTASLPLSGRRGKCLQKTGQNIKDFACPENVGTLGDTLGLGT